MEKIKERQEGSHLELLVGYKESFIEYVKMQLANEEINNILKEYDIILSPNDLIMEVENKLAYYKMELQKRNIQVPTQVNEVNYNKEDILPEMLKIVTYIKNRELNKIKENSYILDDGYYGFDNDYYIKNGEKPSVLLYQEKEKLYDDIIKLITKDDKVKSKRKINYQL